MGFLNPGSTVGFVVSVEVAVGSIFVGAGLLVDVGVIFVGVDIYVNVRVLFDPKTCTAPHPLRLMLAATKMNAQSVRFNLSSGNPYPAAYSLAYYSLSN
jgi:hypothetical protein